ncbi:Zn-ribbon domain-containing OB-fold protein [Parasphingorhabdus halotolerans]|uniref:Zn-ribbon domain-containing OB-fold protein n=1 Tax=Parasphingorhabdus halotolerans TaxID=2725558 RepID=A0A6H2DKU9_9SPHN|nr:OB-fold domain-containing protein [Parasphingorhabdus halotolerans]QJB68767.1 hypothetical protein HF685_05305 [Parasphingorhabdus halotolerans]
MRPDPIQRIDTAFFWEACERGELVAQKCSACNVLWHPPRPICPTCHSTEKTVEKLSGKGKLLSWVRQVKPAAFGFPESPVAILVKLDEGIRLVSNLEGSDVDDIRVGMAVRVEFAETSGGKAVPIFRAAENS